MSRIFRNWLRTVELLRYRLRIKRALALHRRGEVRSDGLALVALSNRIDIRWRARDIHPWDRDLPDDEKAKIFEEQSVEDTEAAIFRLFEALPQVETIDVSVLGPPAENVIISGTVRRADLNNSRFLLSVRMRLRKLGIDYHLPVAG